MQHEREFEGIVPCIAWFWGEVVSCRSLSWFGRGGLRLDQMMRIGHLWLVKPPRKAGIEEYGGL